MKKNLIAQQKSFTLVELLISMMIIMILTAVSFWAYQNRGEGLLLERSTTLALAESEQLKEKAVSSKEFQGIIPEGGYGIYFSLSAPYKFVLFADCNSNHRYDSTTTPCNGFSELIKEVDLERGVYIKSISDVSGGIYIIFQPPSPRILFYSANGSEISSTQVSIVLSLENDPQQTRRIYFNKAGLIYAE